MGKKGVSRKVAKAQRVEIIIGDEWMKKKGSHAKSLRRRINLGQND